MMNLAMLTSRNYAGLSNDPNYSIHRRRNREVGQGDPRGQYQSILLADIPLRPADARFTSKSGH